jgi:hypothetical protein
MQRLHIRTVLCLVFELAAFEGPLAAYLLRIRALVRNCLPRLRDSDPLTAGVLIKGHYGDARRNPLIKVAPDAAAAMVSYGMAPAARARNQRRGHHERGPGKVRRSASIGSNTGTSKARPAR